MVVQVGLGRQFAVGGGRMGMGDSGTRRKTLVHVYMMCRRVGACSVLNRVWCAAMLHIPSILDLCSTVHTPLFRLALCMRLSSWNSEVKVTSTR